MLSDTRKILIPKISRSLIGLLAMCSLITSCGDDESETEDTPVRLKFTLSAVEPLNLTADALGTRLTGLEFDVFANCDPGLTTNSVTHSSYVLGSSGDFTLSAACQNPDVQITNVDVTYENVNGDSVNGTFTSYNQSITNDSSVIKFTKVNSGVNSEFVITETTISKDVAAESIEITPFDVSVKLNNEPNSYCSGATATPSTDKITVQFDAPEAGSPAGTYTFASAASGAGLPTGTSETETSATRTVEYDFSAVAGAALVGSYEFTMTLTPISGQTNDDEYCEATINFDLQAAATNHTPTFAYDASANVANFSGYGTSSDEYTMDVTIGTTNGEVSFDITDEDGQATALIDCSGSPLPSWVDIDDTNDKIIFNTDGTESPSSHPFTCKANDGTADSLKTIYFEINLL